MDRNDPKWRRGAEIEAFKAIHSWENEMVEQNSALGSTSSLAVSDAAVEAIAVAPRVRLADIEAAIGRVYYTTGEHALGDVDRDPEHLPLLARLSLCIVVMRNGFTVVGKSAPVLVENFNAELGRRLAYEDAVRQLWPLMGFALSERLAEHP